jgi:hypothetical protein
MVNAKGILSLIVAFLLCLFLTISATAQDNRGIFVSSERLALVIGNNAYQTAPLRNPVNDAEDMGKVLSTLGFKVILQKNVDRRAMEDSIRSFGRQLRNGGVGLFYFAGHGMQVEGRNYIIPINGRIESESDIKYEAVDAGLVLDKMEDAKNQLNIVILDACRNNPYSRHFRNREQGLARMEAPAGSLIAYSTAPGTVADDGVERNGTFTKHLIRHIMTPNLPVEQVFKRVRIDVATETKQRQIPWESSSLMGDFYFKIERVVHTIPIVVSEPEKSTSINQQPISAPEKATSGIQESKSEYASLPPRISGPSITTTKKKLAIFPIRFTSEGPTQSEHRFFTQNKNSAIASVREVLIDNLNFSPIYSYYALSDKIEYQKIPLAVINEKVEADFFNKENGKPNIDLVVKLGRQLGVDTVFICNCKLETIDLYLIEVNQKGIFHKNHIYQDSVGYSNIPKHIRGFFESYRNSRVE